MGFWGLEVEPGKPQSYHPKNEQGKLHVTQATLGAGRGANKSLMQCSIGDKDPVYLCSLLPDKNECCPLNLEFDDDDEPVEFSVTGDRSIHLSGFMESYEQEYEQDEDDSDGIDIGETESNESSDYDSEEDQIDEFEDFLDGNLEMYRNSSVLKSGVVIEEIEDEEKPINDYKAKRPKKKSRASEDDDAKKQVIAIESTRVPCIESDDEDEDGLPISKAKAPEPENTTVETMDLDNDKQDNNKKRKAKASEQDGVQESLNKNKKKKNQKENKKGETASNEEADEQVQTGNVLKKHETSQKSSSTRAQIETANNAMSESSKTPDKAAEKKNKKKKKKNSSEEATVESKTVSSSAENQTSDSISKENKMNSKSSQVRTYPNGLVVEELAMGKPNAKKAVPGKEVRVRYIGKFQKNGKIFDSNIGKEPFKFRLGIGRVIKGWDVGVNGMRVGDKRRLTIPPSMGYGELGADGQIPPNAWLTFDVELVDVK